MAQFKLAPQNPPSRGGGGGVWDAGTSNGGLAAALDLYFRTLGYWLAGCVLHVTDSQYLPRRILPSSAPTRPCHLSVSSSPNSNLVSRIVRVDFRYSMLVLSVL